MNIYACYEVNCHSLAIEASGINHFCLFSNWDMVKRWFDKAIAQGIHDGFVIDEDSPDKLDAITPAEVSLTMFRGRQENWNESYDITIEIKTLDSTSNMEKEINDL